MLEELKKWVRELGPEIEITLTRLTKESVREHRNRREGSGFDDVGCGHSGCGSSTVSDGERRKFTSTTSILNVHVERPSPVTVTRIVLVLVTTTTTITISLSIQHLLLILVIGVQSSQTRWNLPLTLAILITIRTKSIWSRPSTICILSPSPNQCLPHLLLLRRKHFTSYVPLKLLFWSSAQLPPLLEQVNNPVKTSM